MSNAAKNRRHWTFLVGGLTLMTAAAALAADPPEKIAPPKEAAAEGRVLTLADCLHIAHDNQPAIAAHQASLAAAHTGKKALDDLGPTTVLLRPDVPVRRKQAAIGVEIAEAGLRQVECETAYNVTRMYFTVLYARTQFKLTGDVVSSFDFYYKRVTEGVDKGTIKGKEKDEKAPREWTTDTKNKLLVYLRLAESRRAEAQQGVDRALAGLREALGYAPDCPLVIADDELPTPAPVTISKEQIVALAIAQRGEVAQASLAIDVFDLEVDAQGKHCLPGTVNTFAAGGDIHAKPVPASRSNGEYHPGAVGPEMPVVLAGSKCNRMQRARDFAHRSHAVADKTRGLVILEAEDIYYRYLENSERVAKTKEAADAGRELAKNTEEAFRGGQKVKVEDVLSETMLGAQSRSQYNDALWHYLLTLAGLERVTGCAFCAGFSK